MTSKYVLEATSLTKTFKTTSGYFKAVDSLSFGLKKVKF
jgi:ABC-type oligopeptide transport system ATPase subunit